METVLIFAAVAWIVVGVDLLVTYYKSPEDFRQVH